MSKPVLRYSPFSLQSWSPSQVGARKSVMFGEDVARAVSEPPATVLVVPPANQPPPTSLTPDVKAMTAAAAEPARTPRSRRDTVKLDAPPAFEMPLVEAKRTVSGEVAAWKYVPPTVEEEKAQRGDSVPWAMAGVVAMALGAMMMALG